MARAPSLTVREVPAQAAAPALAGLEQLDPTGLMVAADVAGLAAAGRCFAIEGKGAVAVYVVAVRNGVAWIDAARGAGLLDVTELLDGVLTAQAQGLRALACQTSRPGLVRKLKPRGWRVTGWILRKDLQ